MKRRVRTRDRVTDPIKENNTTHYVCRQDYTTSNPTRVLVPTVPKRLPMCRLGAVGSKPA